MFIEEVWVRGVCVGEGGFVWVRGVCVGEGGLCVSMYHNIVDVYSEIFVY